MLVGGVVYLYYISTMRTRKIILASVLVASSTGTVKTKYDQFHRESYKKAQSEKVSFNNIDNLFKN